MKRTLQFFRRPHFYLLLMIAMVVGVYIDSCRPPRKQFSVVVYVAMVRGYQQFGRPVTREVVSCPYHPTCSRYSLEAVERHGIRRGLMLTFSRLGRCTTNVEMGTEDPVPKR